MREELTGQELIEAGKCGVKGIEAMMEAFKFSASMNKLQSLTGPTKEDFDRMRDAFLALAEQADQEIRS